MIPGNIIVQLDYETLAIAYAALVVLCRERRRDGCILLFCSACLATLAVAACDLFRVELSQTDRLQLAL